MRVPIPAIAAAAVAIVSAGGASWWWWQRQAAPAPEPPVVAQAPAVPAPAPTAEPAASAPPAERHPITAAPAADARPVDLVAALSALLGRGTALALLQTDDLVSRIVATVDSLPGRAAPSRLWPLVPAEGRFSATRPGPGDSVIGADNAARYARHVALLERLEPRAAAQLYRRAYPAFQRAYAELGYPGAHFNDRLVDVIDLLLDTPEPLAPVAVRLPAIGGPVQPERPWVLYEYADAGLQERAIGQRILLRLSPDQRQRVRGWLGAFRREIASA